MQRTEMPAIVGILNATPDSFFDGGDFVTPAAAIEHGLAMARDGADWIDVGGESTRPGAQPVSAAEESARILPVIEALAASGLKVSVDTQKSEVASEALKAGAEMVNDVSAGRHDPRILDVVAEADAFYVAMHMRGTPANMQDHTSYGDIIAEVRNELAERLAAARQAGIRADRLIADPGVGFAKKLEHNVQLLTRFREFEKLGVPLFVGLSRKSTIGALGGEQQPEMRLPGSLAALTVAVIGGASYLRVHDIAASKQAARVAAALRP